MLGRIHCNGLRELCEGLLACEGRLVHLGFDKAPARSTLSDANTQRGYLVFETLYFKLLNKYHSFISDSRLKGLSIRNLKVVDSTTIQLFSEILRGVGCKPLDEAKRKGGLKVHAMMDAFSGVAEFIRMTAAREHDRKFLHHLKLPANSWVVFDKAYNVYRQFAKWTEQKVWFVTRMKDNAVFHVTKVLTDKTKKKNAHGVIKEQYITLAVKQNGTETRLKLRRITFKTKEGISSQVGLFDDGTAVNQFPGAGVTQFNLAGTPLTENQPVAEVPNPNAFTTLPAIDNIVKVTIQ